jgi:hypothetical protein
MAIPVLAQRKFKNGCRRSNESRGVITTTRVLDVHRLQQALTLLTLRRLKIIKILLKISSCIKKGIFFVTHISWLMLFKEIIAVCSGHYAKHINRFFWQNAELLNAKIGGSYSYHWALTGEGTDGSACPHNKGRTMMQ